MAMAMMMSFQGFDYSFFLLSFILIMRLFLRDSILERGELSGGRFFLSGRAFLGIAGFLFFLFSFILDTTF